MHTPRGPRSSRGHSQPGELLDQLKASDLCLDAIALNGDLADKGESETYLKPRAGVEPFAAQLNAEIA